jgi:drug/metabolite transporter (DMT)-like permease
MNDHQSKCNCPGFMTLVRAENYMSQKLNNPLQLQIIAAFAAIYLIWGSTYLGISIAIETMPPFFMAGVRFLIAGAVLFVWMRLRGVVLPTRLHWRSGAIVGALLLLGGNGGVTWAEQFVPSGIAALLIALVPAWIVLIDWLRPGGSRPDAPVFIGLLLGIAGMVLLIGPGNIAGNSSINLIGALALVTAALCWSAGSVYSRHTELPDSPLMATAIEMLCGGLALLMVSGIVGEWQRVDVSAISLRSLLALLYLIVFGAIIAFSAYVWLLKVTSPARAATYAYVNPVVAVFLGWLFLAEPLTLRTIIAAGIIVSAVVVITTYRTRRFVTESSLVALVTDNDPLPGEAASADR